MREVTLNSTSLYETNKFSIKGFSCLFSHHSPIYWFLPEEAKCVFPTYLYKNKWISEFHRKKNTRNWNVDLVSALITSWDITKWCKINLLWKELMGRMSGHTGLISSYQLFITAACTNAGGKMKSCRPRAADRCPFVHRHSKSQVTSFMGFPVVCLWEQQAVWQHGELLMQGFHPSYPIWTNTGPVGVAFAGLLLSSGLQHSGFAGYT